MFLLYRIYNFIISDTKEDKKIKKLRLILCSFLTLILVAVSMPVAANAAAKPVCLKKTTLHYQIAGEQTAVMENLYIGNLSSSASITRIKSSNKHFQAAKSQVCSNGIRVDRKDSYTIKAGEQTTISFNVKQNGKTYKLSSKVTFKKFDQIFKTFKVGNKDYASDFAGYWYTQTSLGSGKKAKIQITPASGYKIDKITAYYIYSNGKNEFGIVGQCLHAKSLEFKHPITGKDMKLEAPLPEYFEKVLQELDTRAI